MRKIKTVKLKKSLPFLDSGEESVSNSEKDTWFFGEEPHTYLFNIEDIKSKPEWFGIIYEDEPPLTIEEILKWIKKHEPYGDIYELKLYSDCSGRMHDDGGVSLIGTNFHSIDELTQKIRHDD